MRPARVHAMKHGLWLILSVLFTPRLAFGWLLHEHTATASRAIATEAVEDRALLDAAWRRAAEASHRLCPAPDTTGEKLYRAEGEFCVGFPVLSGLSADHTCSPWETLSSLDQPFVRDVLFEAEGLEIRMRVAVAQGKKDEHVDLWHLHHLNLQVADPAYLSRAEQNAAHFQPPRRVGENLGAYLRRILQARSSNAIGLYVNYHLAALDLAAKAAAACPLTQGEFQCPPATKVAAEATFARALAAEAFALHFLQDAFSAGHFQTVDGSGSERMGTHDHYCKEGLLAEPWAGGEYAAHGDAFLSTVDTEHIAAAIEASLAMLAKALRSGAPPAGTSHADPDLDACKSPTVPGGLDAALANPDLLAVLGAVPRPVTQPPGLPRFSQELGLFYAPFFGAGMRVGFEGVDADDLESGRWPVFGHIGMGFGGTFEGITDGSTDGVVALGGALGVDVHPPGSQHGIGVVYAGAFHLPYYVIPGDLIPLALVGVVDAITGGDTYFRMARAAASGGAFGLQRKYSLFWNMRLQFVLGREGYIAAIKQHGDPDKREYYLKFGIPVFTLTSFHASSGQIGLDQNWQLGYDLTYRKPRGWVENDEGKFFHGIFLSYGLRARRYVWEP